VEKIAFVMVSPNQH